MGEGVAKPSPQTPDLRRAAETLLGIQLTARQLELFQTYSSELRAWNERFNLTAITEPGEIQIKHFLDSLTCLLAMGPGPTGRAVDVGAGAGFPGLPLKIACPELKVTLVESNGKKVRFCRHIVETLALEGVEVLQARAEEVGQEPDHRQAYDWALARAVAALPSLVEYLLPLVRLGGRAIAQKGDTAPAEVQAAEGALEILGGRFRQLISVELPAVAESRFLVVIDKVSASPREYPRRPGVPVKKPLGGRGPRS